MAAGGGIDLVDGGCVLCAVGFYSVKGRRGTKVVESLDSYLTGRELEALAMSIDEILILVTRAGLGHQRVGEAVIQAGKSLGVANVQLVNIRPRTDGAHYLGSNDRLVKSVTEYAQRHTWLQRTLAWPYSAALGRLYEEPVAEALEKNVGGEWWRQRFGVLGFQPEAGLGLGKLLEKHDAFRDVFYGQVITDHMGRRPQDTTAMLLPHVLYVPDGRTGDMISGRQQVYRNWWMRSLENRHRTKIKMCPLPVDPRLLEELEVSSRKFRLEQLDKDNEQPLRILFSPGGSAPRGPMMLEMARKFSQKIVPVVVMQQSDRLAKLTDEFVSVLGENHVFGEKDADGTITAFVEVHKAVLPVILVTKPSELSAMSMVEFNKLGGELVFYLKPVGDHEVQNLDFLAEKGLIPSEVDNEDLVAAILNGELEVAQRLIGDHPLWRGLRLPEDPEQAAVLIEKGYEMGLWKQMYEDCLPILNDPEVREDGAYLIWKLLAEELLAWDGND